MAKNQDFPTLIAWLMAEGADENVAPRHVTLQIAGSDEDDSPEGLVAIASIGEEDYIAGEPNTDYDVVAALDSLDDALSSEAGRLLAAEREDG